MDRKEAIELIKRHMIIHQIGEYPHIKLAEALSMAIEALQEPEIVYCKECKHWDKEIMYCNHTGMQIEAEGYCVYGESDEELKQVLAKELGCSPDEITRIIP